MFAGGQETQRILHGFHQYWRCAQTIFQHIVMHDIAAHDNDLLALQIRFTRDGRFVSANEYGMVDHGVRSRKIDLLVTRLRVEHAGDGVYFAYFQRLADLIPRTDSDLDIKIRGLCNGARQINIVTGGLTALIAE